MHVARHLPMNLNTHEQEKLQIQSPPESAERQWAWCPLHSAVPDVLTCRVAWAQVCLGRREERAWCLHVSALKRGIRPCLSAVPDVLTCRVAMGMAPLALRTLT